MLSFLNVQMSLIEITDSTPPPPMPRQVVEDGLETPKKARKKQKTTESPTTS